MRYKTTITPTEMRGINRTAILDIIRGEGPIPRTSIAKRLQISLPTVIRIVDELIKEGLAIEPVDKEFSGGRRRSLVAFNAAGNLAIGIDLGGTKMYGAVVDFGGQVFYEERIPRHNTRGEESYRLMCELIEHLLAFAEKSGKCIRGIGVGAPGVTLPEEGIVEWAPSLEWRRFPLKERLMARFGFPVIVDNDVNLSALGELWFGAGQNVENLVLMTIGTGIGAGVVIDGAIFRGSHKVSGEIGYLLPDAACLEQTYDGFGALEQMASGTGIAMQARKRLTGKLPAEQLEEINAEYVFDAARNGETWAREVLKITIDYLAQGVAALSLCFDPDVIVLGGGVAHSADLLIEPILARLDGRIPHQPHLAASVLGSRAAAMGASIGLLYEISRYYVVRRLF